MSTDAYQEEKSSVALPIESATEEIQKSPERRSTAPREQLCRRLFDRYWKIIRRYSTDTQDLRHEQITSLLKEEVDELSSQDALISLLLHKKEGKLQIENDNIQIGVYRLVYPSIKQLNDTYLGPNQTDDFIDELNKSINGKLARNSGHKLNTNFKRGVFVMNFTDLVNGSGRPAEEVLSERVAEIQGDAQRILEKHIGIRIESLEKKINELPDTLDLYDPKDPEATDKLIAQIEKLEETIKGLKNLQWEVSTGETKTDIAFGFDTLKPDPRGSYMAIRNAECAANIAALRNGHQENVKMYSHQELLVEAIKGLQILGDFDMFNEKGDIKEEWQSFFKICDGAEESEKDLAGYVLMQPEMIKNYRRIDKYRLSHEYRRKSREEQKAFDDKIQKFEKYYTRINIVDVLKNFTEPNIDLYLQKIERLTNLISKSKALLAKEESKKTAADYESMRELLDQTSHELEISLKDSGKEIVQTTRAAIKSLMDEGTKLLVFTDNIGFGGLNQGSYERSVIRIINMLNISDDEYETINRSPEKLTQLVERKYEEVKDNPQFMSAILGIGDEGTEQLRVNEQHLHELFEGTATINADGGDESRAFFHFDKNPNIPTDTTELQNVLHKFSDQFRIRVAAVLTDFTFSKNSNPSATLAIVEEQQREEIVSYIEHLLWADEKHNIIKERNAKGENEIGLKRSFKQAT